MFWRKNYYYCINVTQCQRAITDYAYSEAEFEKHNGCCIGTKNHPCNEKLMLGISRPRYEIAFIVLILVSFFGLTFNKAFPELHRDIIFVNAHSEINETDKILEIIVSREESGSEISINYRINSITAKPSEDFLAEDGIIFFPRNQRQAKLIVPILEDADSKEGREFFKVQLTNVVGKPIHQVIILDTQIPEEHISKADVMVKQQSILATDLAGYVKKGLVLQKSILNMPTDTPIKMTLIEQLSINQEKLSRARDAYISGFNALKTIDQPTVLSALDNWISSLKVQSMEQQHKATLIMKHQYQRYAENNSLEMDIWLNELLTAIPDKNSKSTESPVRTNQTSL